MNKIPFVDYPVLCGECGEQLFRKWAWGEEPIYLHSTIEERKASGHRWPDDCPHVGKKFKLRNPIVEVEEIPV